jgi:hypothetical protein
MYYGPEFESMTSETYKNKRKPMNLTMRRVAELTNTTVAKTANII